MLTKSIVRDIVFSIGLLVFMQSALAQTGSVAATVQLIPASEIMSAPMGTASDPVESLSIVPLANGGAWANSAGGPTIYSKNIYYYLQLNPVGSIPATATITSISWSWGLSYKPAGLIVYLCHDTTSACIDVTSLQSGSTSSFINRPANKKMIYAFGVAGSGTLYPPAYGQVDQVIVNYQY
ncbi:flagellar protein FlhE [Methylobacter sp. G7]|uniref:flagellar protein FlhE n=1 Tax=Methylobacter sp. G7 TaxID=3230117 RepID=UPI003D800F46